jgi:hypothetical protein
MTGIIATIANLALALSVIVALVFGVAQVRSAERDRRERFTLETLRGVQTREFVELIYYLNTHKLPTTGDEVRALPQKEQVAFIQFGQTMESLGILVAEGSIDIDLVDKTLGSYVVTTWEQYKPAVVNIRRQDPYLNEYFQWLAEQIDARMKNNPRKPFYEAPTPRVTRRHH